MEHSKDIDHEEYLMTLGMALERNKVQCGYCSNAFILLEVQPDWDHGMWICEKCSEEDYQLTGELRYGAQ